MLRHFRFGIQFLMLFMVVGLISIVGCDSESGTDVDGGKTRTKKLRFMSMGTAPTGGVFKPVGDALCATINDHKGDVKWKAQPTGTKGSQENIRRLAKGDLQLALSNSAISHFALKGKASWTEEYNIRAVVTIAPNVAMFITNEGSGIKTMADLKGKRVVCGPAGAGFEMFLEPILKAHGLTFDDFGKKLNGTQNGAVEMLADGQADAAFLGGAVPAPSITRACNEQDVVFIPFEESALDSLVAEYPFFNKITIPADKYKDMKEDFKGLNVGSMHVITSADMDEENVYVATKAIYENRESIGHPACKKFINEKNAARNTGIPFHPGAIKFYKEAGIWKEDEKAKPTSSETK